MNFLQCVLSFIWVVQVNSAYVFAQYMLEVIESPFTTKHLVLQCQATGANFGQNVLDFSFSSKAVGCAIFAEPRNACTPVQLKPLNGTAPLCDTYFAVVSRGNCSFSEKAFNVQNAKPFGFDALVVYNEINEDPISMSGSIHASDVNIPSIMVNYKCMKDLTGKYSATKGYLTTMKANPGYYDLIRYLIPFVVIVGLCFIILFISLVVRLCRERRRLAKKRLSRSALKKLPIKKFKKGEGPETCAICLEDFVESEKLRELPCKHAFHSRCIDPWLLKNKKSCPLCKRKVGPSNGSDSDSDTERQTTTNSVASTSRDSEPLLTNVYNNAVPTSGSRPSILNLRWLPYNNQSNTTAQPLPQTTPMPNSVSLNDLPTQNSETEPRVPVVERVGSAVNRAWSSLRRKFTRSDSNSHRRLENDDTLSTIILDSDVENPANANRYADNAAYANSSNGDGTSMTTVHSNQYCVQAEVEPVPNENQEEIQPLKT